LRLQAAWSSAGVPPVAFVLALLTSSSVFSAEGAPPAADYQGPLLVYADASFLRDATTIDSGATIALNGDLARKGFIVELYAGLNLYNYRNSDVPGGKVDANVPEFYARIGYQWFMGNLRFETTIGDDFQQTNLNPDDPSNPTRGAENGFMVAAELETNEPKPIYFDLTGEFSTANDSYWSRARTGYKFGDIIVGPEGIFLGDITFNSQRVGGFFTFPLKFANNRSLGISLSGGYSFFEPADGRNGGGDPGGAQNFGGASGSGNSPYGAVAFSTNF